MYLFFKKIVGFTFILLLIIIISESSIRSIPNDYSYKNDYLTNNADELEIIFLGSSHAFYGINPEYIDGKSFNASYISQSLDLDYMILNKFKDDFNNLNYIVIPVSYFSLFSKLEEGIESWRLKNYYLYYDLEIETPSNLNSEILGGDGYSNMKKIVKHYILRRTNVTCNESGYGLTYKSSNKQNLELTGPLASERHTKDDLGNYSEGIRTLENIISLAEKRNISILLYTPPAWKTYYNNLDDFQLNKTIKGVIELSNENSNVFYINYMRDDRFISSDYFDADHLNEIGAEKLSKLINNELIKLNKN